MNSSTEIQRNIEFVPEQLLESLNVSKPAGEVFVRGTVTQLNPYKDLWVYGTLVGRDCAISFRCPPDRAPKRSMIP